jgi:hypothetical protein
LWGEYESVGLVVLFSSSCMGCVGLVFEYLLWFGSVAMRFFGWGNPIDCTIENC